MKKHFIGLLPYLMICTAVSAQTQITGKVVDANGIALPGVNVSVKNTQTGTLTDLNGSFTLPEIPNGHSAILVFSYVVCIHR